MKRFSILSDSNHVGHRFFVSFRYALAFLTPGLPFIPAIAITVNIYLIFKLSILTLVRFTVWMILGLVMYFYYGITNSSLENAQEEIELTVDQTHLAPPPQKPHGNHYSNQTPTAVWDRHGYENKMAEDSWTTAATVTNNYTTNSWDINEVNSAWNDPAPRTETVTTAKKPTISARSSGVATGASSSKGKPAPPPRPATKPAAAAPKPTPPKSGFSGIFVDETQFPTWDD